MKQIHIKAFMEKISVCIASFNGEQFIERQIDSILKQISFDDEIVISDDGSIDKTVEIINSYKDYRIKLYLNEDRHGIIGNFENAIRHSTGSIIFLADQDDVWLPDKVKNMRVLLGNNDLVVSDCEVVDKALSTLHSSFFELRGSKKGFWNNLYRNSYVGCCMAFRSEILGYVLPFPAKIHMHDWWIGLLVEIKGSTVFYDKPMIQYVRHGNNASPTGGVGFSILRQFLNRYQILLCVLKRLLS